MANKRKGGLGRGLEALFLDATPIYEDESINREIETETGLNKSKREEIIYIDINDIKPNTAQPRQTFNEEKLEELAKSIKSNGIIQPVVVRSKEDQHAYELVAGERRWRAARIAGLKKIPSIVKNIDDKQNVIFAILENMQREDLNPIEEAVGINKMITAYEFTQQEAAEILGKSRTYITNSLRLLKLPNEIQESITRGDISAAHARTLINIDENKKKIELCEKIIKEGLSVRETEKLANKNKKNSKPGKRKNRNAGTLNPDIISVQEELIEKIGTKVSIKGTKNHGKIEVEYYNIDDLNKIIDALRSIKDR